MRAFGVVTLMLLGCGRPSPKPSPPPQMAKAEHVPSQRCQHEADEAARRVLDHFVVDVHQVWRNVRGKPEFGFPSQLTEDKFVAFVQTQAGRDWLRGSSTVFASVRIATLRQCEANT